ncbi:MAG: polyprenol monophosphomannose synthase [Chloroflexi bacterium]|jgi:dolichol-phosphate mannosyltransferase|nr:polyprenol monophosphomannose synthase [Chloroflexota bacterium]
MQPTIVIPTYNEAENITKLIPILFNLPIESLKVLIVDDGSPDGTGDIANEFSMHYPNQIAVFQRGGKLGFGSAYIQGFQRALAEGAECIVQMDADFSHPPEKIGELLTALESHDVVIGSRYIPDGQLDDDWPLWRKALSAFGNYYAREILRLSIKDVTGGFRAWRRETLASMPLGRVRSNGYSFQIEMIHIAHRLGFRFYEIPIYFAERNLGESKMSFQIQLEAALRVWQIRMAYQDLKPLPQLPLQGK